MLKIIYPYAISFYGEEYEDIICESLKGIEYYHTNENETVYKAISRITNTVYKEKDNKYIKTSGIYCSRKTITPSLEINKRRIVVFSKTFDLLSAYGVSVVAHEIFSHAVQDNDSSDQFYNNRLISKSGVIVDSCENLLMVKLLKEIE